MNNTNSTILSQLTENTGSHFLDSGGAYGRNHERNRHRDFEAEPSVSVKFSTYGDNQVCVEVSKSLYHFLSEHLEAAPELQAEFDAYVKAHDNDGYLQDIEGFLADTEDEYGECRFVGPFGEHDPRLSCNSYNEECCLDQTIQFTLFKDTADDECYVLLQVHGGCDVRGGYTAPKAYRLTEGEPSYFLSWNDATIRPISPDADEAVQPNLDGTVDEDPYWTTDDGYHWYREGCCGCGARTQLEAYEASDDPADKGKGKIYIDEDGNGYCPVTGRKLEVY